MSAFLLAKVYIDWQFSLLLIPVAGLGHYIGLKIHDQIVDNDTLFKRWMGSALLLVCIIGLLKVFVL